MAAGNQSTVLVIHESDELRKRVEQALVTARICDRVIQAADGVQGMSTMLAEDVTVVLTGLNMPRLGGLKLLAHRRSKPELADLPMIILLDGESVDRLRVLEEGADDYLIQPFYDKELVNRVRLHLQRRTLQRRVLIQSEKLDALKRADQLTGIANRKFFGEVFRREIARAERYENPLSLLLIDIDEFRELNEEQGHLFGDQLLVELSECIREGLRDCDIVGRTGGDEFALLLPEADTDGAFIVAERIRERVSQRRFAFQGVELTCTISIGLVTFPTHAGCSVDEMFRRVGFAVKGAKKAGRNHVVIGDRDL